jgi:pimeloyl-ACP methyl ester carboxylesterase
LVLSTEPEQRIGIWQVSSLRCLNNKTTHSVAYRITSVFELGESKMTDSLVNQQIKLRDGRMLGFAEYGVSDGQPILYFHGHPASRRPGIIPDGVAVDLNARVIAVDRPGHGLSDFYR